MAPSMQILDDSIWLGIDETMDSILAFSLFMPMMGVLYTLTYSMK